MNTTISIPNELRDNLKEFGNKGDTYGDIIRRLLKSAKERMLHDFLYDDTDCVPVKDALKRAKIRWS